MEDRWTRLVGYGGGAAAAAALVGAGVLVRQVQLALRDIPLAQAPPPRADGRYGGRHGARPGGRHGAGLAGEPLTLVVLGDSVAAGYGADKPRETPGALLATGVSRRLDRPVQLHVLAVVGATSRRLRRQVEAALELAPDLALIVVGANDITHGTNRTTAVSHLVRAVGQLRAAGARVVVGTCPDLGTVRPLRAPLRQLARRWSRQLAAAQTVAVVEGGGWTVSLGGLLGPRFAAEPYRMFGRDGFHPSADGYAAATAALLPTTLAALGATHPSRAEGVRSLPQAAVAASRRAGTEVSGATVAGQERGPRGRWATLRTRFRAVLAASDPVRPAATDPSELLETR